jgi:hypothetical protein
MKDLAILIDAVASGNAMAGELKSRGIECWHLWTTKERKESSAGMFNPEFYTREYVMNKEWIDIKTSDLWEVKRRIVAIIPGSDSGVASADMLADSLDVQPRNSIHTLMRRQSRAQLTGSLGEPATIHEFEYFLMKYGRIIIKPERSNGGYERVTVVEKPEQIPADTTGLFAQPFYYGNEYGVDTVSYNGRHRIVAIWRYKKRLNSIMRWHVELVDPAWEPRICADITYYVTKVLNCADYRVGCTHTEIMTAGNDFFNLIESNFRNHNGMDYFVTKEACDRNQVQLGIDAYLGIDREFTDDKLAPKPLQKRVSQLFFTNTVPGKKRNSIPWENIQGYPCVKRIFAPPTEELAHDDFTYRNMTCSILLMHQDPKELMKAERYLMERMAQEGQRCV